MDAAASSKASSVEAWSRCRANSRISDSPAGFKKILHPGDFGVVVGVGAAFEAGGEAHLHFGIDAAGESGIGMQVFDAAAHFEEVERVAGEFLGGGAGGERAVIEIVSRSPLLV